MTDKDILACVYSQAKHLTKLWRITESMVSESYRKLFRILCESKDRDLVKLIDASGIKSAELAEISIIAQEIEFEGKFVDKDIDAFVDDKYKKWIRIYNEKGDNESILKLLRLKAQAPRDSVVEKYERYLQEYSEYEEGKLLGISTGIPLLDDMTKGMIQGHVWVVGAYYGYGKTFLALNLIDEIIAQGKKVLFLSLEMSSDEILNRLIGMTSKIGSYKAVLGKLPEKEHIEREGAKAFWLRILREGMLTISTDYRSTEEVLTKMAFGDYDVLVLDYLQIVNVGRDEYEGLRDLSKQIQALTIQRGVTSILLSQVSNQSQREGKMGKVDGFKGAGEIGQIANIAIKIGRYKKDGEWLKWFDIDVVKNRHGKIGTVVTTLNFPAGRILPLTDKEKDEYDDFIFTTK